MDIGQIETFLEKEKGMNVPVRIQFKKRDSITGIFIKGNDYPFLKSKNFWRIVTGPHLEGWKKKQDINLARLFQGNDFAKLTLEKQKA